MATAFIAASGATSSAAKIALWHPAGAGPGGAGADRGTCPRGLPPQVSSISYTSPMEDAWREILNFIAVTQFCGKHWFRIQDCGVPLAATIALLVAGVLSPIGFVTWRLVRNHRQRVATKKLLRAHFAEEARVASELTMDRLRWNGEEDRAVHLTEAQMAEQIRDALKWRKVHGEQTGARKQAAGQPEP